MEIEERVLSLIRGQPHLSDVNVAAAFKWKISPDRVRAIRESDKEAAA